MIYAIGTQFKSRDNKNGYLCTVTDIFRTYNSKGELVKIQYQATHEFAGQVVTNNEVPAATISRNLVK